MRKIHQIYIDGHFFTPHGTETPPLHNPATEQVIGEVRLADEGDARAAVAAAKRSLADLTALLRTTRKARIASTVPLRALGVPPTRPDSTAVAAP
ncbi:hypothetical protein [Streptomyces sp. NPDC047706]|uniref:hypothetical protein n=1 Tax=Streptomyces sp. NPDC047706 TaxID=3365486 RepID=UPI003721266E